MKEREVKAYFLRSAAESGCLARKVRWEGVNSAPDWCLMYPRWPPRKIWPCVWVELKATGEEPTAAQLQEHKLMREYGQVVFVVSSVAEVDALFL